MGGKTGTTTQDVKIPKEVLERYNAVNKRAEGVANTPFQEYSKDPSSFVAQLNPEQLAATQGINRYANAAQPGINYAMAGYTPEGFGKGVQGYMNPFLESAVGATTAQMQNVAQQQQQKMLGSAIGQGAFGGDRANIGLGALQNQQNLALGQTIGQMESQGFQDAARNYMAGLGQIGTLAQQGQLAGLQGAQAMMGAGTLGQQTEQAGKTALYNQFLQKQSYPFQVAQFLANIAEGTGALSGSTTTTTQPMGFFSDKRLKEDVKRIGETNDGQTIYKYRYKHDPEGQTHIGLMAQEVEKHHPNAVGLAAGYKTVDYDKATKDAESMGGGVLPSDARGNFYPGGAATNPMMDQYASAGYGSGDAYSDGVNPYSAPTAPSARSINIPMAASRIRSLALPGAPPKMQSGLSEAATDAANIAGLMKMGKQGYDWGQEHGLIPKEQLDLSQYPKAPEGTPFPTPRPSDLASGGVAGYRRAYAEGSAIPYEDDDTEKNKPMKGLDIPNEAPTAKLPTPGAVGAPQSGLAQLGQLASLGSSLGNLGSMASKAFPALGTAASGIASGIGSAAAGLGTAAAAAGETAMSWLPMLLLSTGGVAAGRRQGHKNGEAVVPPNQPPVADEAPVTNEAPVTDKAPADDSGVAAAVMPKTAIAPTFDNILGVSRSAIRKIESGGGEDPYGIVGPVTRHKVNGEMVDDVPLGAYGVMRSNIPSWTKEALGKEMTPEEFLANPKAQDAVFNHHFGKNLKETGNPLDAASIWFTGKTTAEAGSVKDILGTTNQDYLGRFTKESGLGMAKNDMEKPTETPSGGLGDISSAVSGLLPQSNEAKLAMLAGVFGMLASPSPFLLQAIGHGGLAGVKTYEDLTRLKNESLKNAQEFINNNFTTNDGVNWFSKVDGRVLNREQYAAAVKQIYQRAGVGSTGAGVLPTTPGAPAELNVPTVEAPKAPDVVTKAVETAKTVTPSAQPTTDTTKPVETPTKPDETKPAVSADTVKPDETTKPTETKTPSPEEAYDPAAIKNRIANDPNVWKNAAPNLNYPALVAKGDEQEAIRAKAQEDAATFSARVNDPVGGKGFEAKANAALARATAAEKNRDRFYEMANKALDLAAQGPIDKAKKDWELSKTPVDVEPTLTGGTQTITQLTQLQDPSIIKKQNPEVQAKMKGVFEEDAKLDEEAQARAIAHQRSNAIKYVLEHYETGRWAEQKANIIGYLQSAGFNINSKDASSLDELVKLANGQVFDMMKGVNASKFTNLEMGNLGKTNVNPNIMPDANGQIWAQNDAMLDYLDDYYAARMDFRKSHRDDPFVEYFSQDWRKDPKNDLTKRVNERAKEIAPAGMAVPKSADNLIDGRKYNIPPDPNRKMLPQGGMLYWDGKQGKFVQSKPLRD